MTEASGHVHFVEEIPELDDLEQGPVLLHCLEGFLDAGNAAGLATAHLVERSPGRVVATLDIDAFYDYRARRPPMTFAEDHYEGYTAPSLVVRVAHDDDGAPYLLLHGPEPDTHWEAFALAVRTVVERLGVRLTVGMGSVPMAVPHTRPVMLTNHATDPQLLLAENVWKGQIRVPASAQALLELRLGEWGHPAMGFVAHIPHYVAQFDYPSASATMLESVQVVSGLHWELADLVTAGDTKLVEIAEQIEDSTEVREVVSGLEQQYDSFHRMTDPDLPTGEELGAEFERFLAGLDRPEAGE